MPHTPSPVRIHWERKGAAALADKSCIMQTHSAPLGARTVTVEERVPQLAPQEYAERLRDIEYDLYDIFIQYEDKSAGA